MQSRHRNRSGVVHLTKFFQEERRVEAGRGVSLVKEEQSHMWSEEGGVSSFCAPTGLVWAWLCSVSVSSHLQGHPPGKAGFHLLSCVDFNCQWMFMLLSKKVASIYILLGSFKHSAS